MVAIVGGSELGLSLGSFASLGARGALGLATQGRNAERAYVNVATGNLVLQDLDGFLAGRGPDVATLRTYNSQGTFDFDNGDNWIGASYRSVTRVDANTLRRTDSDGSTCEYLWDAGRSLYVASYSPGSALDTIAVAGTAATGFTYTWTDGATGTREVYRSETGGLIESVEDAAGNQVRYHYDTSRGLLTSVETSAGELVTYDYGSSGRELLEVSTSVGGQLLQKVTYGYESYAGSLRRLRTVTVDLGTLDEAGQPRTYLTTYGYRDGSSKLVASITQSDGTSLGFTYEGARIKTVSDGNGGVTTFDYFDGRTRVTDASDHVTDYLHDAQGRLIEIRSGVTDTRPEGLTWVRYAYDALGNVVRITDAYEGSVVMTYEGGNLMEQRDAAGNRVAFTYTARNLVQTETAYPAAGGSQTTRHVYDARGLLRFTVSAEGRVTEHRYDAQGLRIRTISYAGALYDTAGLEPTQVPGLEGLEAWAAAQDPRRTQLTDLTYDHRGELWTRISYQEVGADGLGVEATAVREYFHYGERGQLLRAESVDTTTVYVYDGLGRQISVTSSGGTLSTATVTEYRDASSRTVVTLANGLVTSSLYDAAGRLVAVEQSDARDPGDPGDDVPLGTTRYFYDEAGRLLMTEDPTGLRQWALYDEAGQKVADIDATGALREHRYDANGRLTRTLGYATLVDTGLLVDAAGEPAAPALDDLRPAAGADDTTAWNVYDEAGRLTWQVDALGYVTRTEYDGASRVASETRYATPIDTALLGDGNGASLALAGFATSIALGADPFAWSNGHRVLTATVSRTAGGEPPPGAVAFFAGDTCLGSAELVNGAATLLVDGLAAGSYAVTARYAGEGTAAASGTDPVSVTLEPGVTTSVALTASPPAQAGAAVTLTATVSGGSPTGEVRFYRGAELLGSAWLSGGTASLEVTSLPAGSHDLTAVYLGDPGHETNSSQAVRQEVTRYQPSLGVYLHSVRSEPGAPVFLRAQVNGLHPTGTVTFQRDGVAIGSAELVAGIATLVLSDLPEGANHLTAAYEGDSDNEAVVTYGYVTLTVCTRSATTLVLSTDAPDVGAPLTLTASISGASPTGAVAFFDGTTLLGSAVVSNGQAKLVLAGLSEGEHSFEAVYTGDGANTSSASAAIEETVVLAPTVTTLESASSATPSGTQLILTARVTGQASPTGMVTFYDGATELGSAVLSGGQAVLALTDPAAKVYDLRASYGGDAGSAASVSASALDAAGFADTTTALASSLASAAQGTAVTLTATVSRNGGGVTPAGTVTFLRGTTVLGTAALVNGQAALSIASLPVGTAAVSAVYSGDGVHATSAASLSQAVTQAPATVTLTTSAASATAGAPVLLTARVTSGASTLPGGTVTFYRGTTSLGTATLVDGYAALTVTNLPVGASSITASYAGDASTAAATSAAVVETITAALAATTVTFTSAPTTATAGTAFTLRVSVTGSTPTGTVTFLDGTNVIGTAAVSNGVATLTTARLYTSGAHSAIRATYSGNGTNATSVSAVRTITVTGTATPASRPATTTALSLSAAATARGTPVTLTATVTGASPTGTVSFFDGTTLLGSAALSGNTARLTLASLAVGSHSLRAVYSGDTNDNSSISAIATETVSLAASATTLVASTAQATQGAAVTLLARVTGALPGGTVSFYNGTTPLGTATLANGLASLTVSNLPVGSLSLTAQYGGDGNNATSNSAAVPVAVAPAKTGSSTVLTTSAQTVGAGAPLTLTATVNGATGGTVSFFNGTTLLGSAVVMGGRAELAVESLPIGPANLQAVYSGDAQRAGSSSNVAPATVAAAATTTTLATSSSGASLTLTARVTGTGNPAGVVVFYDGATEIGRQNLSAGQATLAVAVANGQHDFRAEYLGSGASAASISAVASEAVSTAAPTSLSNLTAAVIGHEMPPLAVRVNGSSPTGTVTFLAGGTVLGTAPVVDGAAYLFGASVPLGTLEITATYSGDETNAGSSLQFTQSVARQETFTDIHPSVPSSPQNVPVVLKAVAGDFDSTGLVTFYSDGVAIGTAEARCGIAALSVSDLAPGTHLLTISYAGDARHAPSATQWNQSTLLRIEPEATNVALTSPTATVARGDRLTLSARVTGNRPTGRVVFTSGAEVLGSAPVVDGVATLALAEVALPEGTAAITATYAGDEDDSSAISSSLALAVTAGSLRPAPGISVAASDADRVVTRIHSRDGLLLATIDGEGYLTEFRYDAAGRPVETIAYANRVPGFTDATSISARVAAARIAGSLDVLVEGSLRPVADGAHDIHTYAYFNARGQEIGRIDGEGHVTETRYDTSGRVEQVIRYAGPTPSGVPVSAATAFGDLIPDPVAGEADQVTSYGYDGLGRLETETNAEQTVTRYGYDVVGNRVERTVAEDTAAERSSLVRLDVQGRVTHELSAEGAALLPAATNQAAVDAIWAAHATRYTYDQAGRRTSAIDALGHRTVYYYDEGGRLKYTVNAEGEVSRRNYDTLGRLWRTTQFGARLGEGQVGQMQGGMLADPANGDVEETFTAVRDAGTGNNEYTFLRYDTRGELVEARDVRNGETRFSRNAFGEVATTEVAIDWYGRTLVSATAYDRRGLQTGAVADAGDPSLGHVNATTGNEYDAFGRLTCAIDANGNRWAREYDRDGRLVATVDPTNARRVTTYDAFDRVYTQTDALNQTTTFRYDDAARTVVLTTPEGISVTTEHNAHGQTVRVTDGNQTVTRWHYDRDGRLRLKTADGIAAPLERNEYDRAGNLEDAYDANGNRVHYEYNGVNRVLHRTVDPDGLALKTSYEYDAQGRQVAVIDANGVATTYEYDSNGDLLRQTVDPTDRNPDGLNLVTEYSYDYRGKVLRVTSPGGTVTEYQYDDLGRRIETIVDPQGLRLRETFAYDDAGNLVNKTDRNGNMTRYVYDGAYRLVFTIDAPAWTEELSYDAEGRITRIRNWRYTGPDGSVLPRPTLAEVRSRLLEPWSGSGGDGAEYRVYDRDGRLTFVVTRVGRDAAWVDRANVKRTKYDRAGNVIEQTSYANQIDLSRWTPGTEPLIADSARDRRLRTVRDALGRAVFTVDGTGAVVKQEFDGNGNVVERRALATTIAKANEMGVTTLTLAHLDALGTSAEKQAELEDFADAAADPNCDALVRRQYDRANRLAWSADGTGAVTHQVFDGNGNIVKTVAYAARVLETQKPAEVAPSSTGADRVTVAAYDAAGRMRFTVDALGGVTERVLDAHGHQVQHIAYATRLAEPATGDSPISLDELEATVLGIQDAEADRVSRFVHDAAGRVRFEIDPVSAVTEHEYDGAGNVTQTIEWATPLADPSLVGRTATVGDMESLLPSQLGDSDRQETRRYDATNRLVQRNGAYGVFTYTNAPGGLLSSIYHFYGTNWREYYQYDAAGRTITVGDGLSNDEHFTYDGAGNKLTFTNKNGATWTYDYDTAGRTIREVGPPVDVTTVGADGTTTVARIPVESRIRYDALGNVTSRIEAYGLSGNERETSYRYDQLGRQVETTHPEVGVCTVQGGAAPIGALGVPDREAVESAQRLSTKVDYDVFGDAVICTDLSGIASFKVYDKLGRVRFEVDAEGYVTGYERDTFGDVRVLTRYAESVASVLPLTGGGARSAEELALALNAVAHDGDRAIHTRYDQAGQAIEITQPEAWAFDGVESSTNGQSHPGTLSWEPSVTRNSYNAFGELVQTSARVGGAAGAETWATTTHIYDRNGKKSVSVDPLGNLTMWSWDGMGNMVWEQEFLSVVAGWTALSAAEKLALSQSSLFQTKVPWHGGTRMTRFRYDQCGRKTGEVRVGVEYSTQPDGTTVRGELTTSYAYDAVGNLTCVTDPLGNKTYTYYDALGRIRAVAAPTRHVVPGEAVTLTPLTTFLRDALGNVVVQIEHASGAVSASASGYTAGTSTGQDRHTYRKYDKLGRVIQTTNAENHSTYASYNRAGQVALEWEGVTLRSVVDPSVEEGMRTRAVAYEYDKLGRQSKVIAPGAGTEVSGTDIVAADPTSRATTESRYNGFGEVTQRATYAGTTAPVEPEKWEYFDYDNAGRLWRTNAGDGVCKVMLYDLMGRQTALITSSGMAGAAEVGSEKGRDLHADTSLQAFSLAAWVDGVQTLQLPAGLRSTFTEYDLLGRAVRITLPERADASDVDFRPEIIQTFDRWGNVITRTDPRNAAWVTRFRYNELDKLVKKTEPSMGLIRVSGEVDANGQPVLDTVAPVTRYYYDALGRQIATIDANDNISTQEWDEAGQLVAEVHADADATGGVVRHRYDAFGQQVELSDAENNLTSYTYDKMGRVKTITSDEVVIGTVWVNGQTGEVAVPEAATGPGHLVTEYAYDEAGNRVKEERYATEWAYGELFPQQRVATSYAYDLRGNQVAARQPMGQVSRFAYDAAGHKAADRDANGSLATWEYDALGRLIGRLDVGGSMYELTYDEAGQLVRQRNSLASFALENDPVYGGLFTWANMLRPRQDVSYAYDAAGQVVGIRDARLDVMGNDNPANDKVTEYAYNAAGQRVMERTRQDGIAYQDQILAYDELGRLATVTSAIDDTDVVNAYHPADATQTPEVTVAFYYDKVGNRLCQKTTYRIEEGYQDLSGVWVDGNGAGLVALVDPVTGKAIQKGFIRDSVEAAQYAAAHGIAFTGSFVYLYNPYSLHAEYRVTQTRSETLWFAYDEMNRQILVDGDLNGVVDENGRPDLGNVVPDLDGSGNPLPTRGHILAYDHKGNRIADTHWGKRLAETPAGNWSWLAGYEFGRQVWVQCSNGPNGVPGPSRAGAYDGEIVPPPPGPNGGLTFKWTVTGSAYATTDDGIVNEEYQYDAADRLTDVVATDALIDWTGHARSFTLEHRTFDWLSRVIQAAPVLPLDTKGNPTSAPLALLTAGAEDAPGASQKLSLYDLNGRLDKQQVSKLDGSLDYSVEYRHDSDSLVHQRWNSRGGDDRLLYDAAGRPIYQALYRYADGSLVPVPDALLEGAEWPPDRIALHDASGALLGTAYTTGLDEHQTRTDSGYDAAGNVQFYRIVSHTGGATVWYDVSQIKRDGYLQSTIEGRRSDNQNNPGTLTSVYDANGYLVALDDHTDPARNRTFVNDASGVALLKVQEEHRLRQLVVNGQVLAVYGEGKPDYSKPTAEFDLVYEPITSSSMTRQSAYTVRSGDSLPGIAQAVYGDASLWYLIADANGLSGAELRPGMEVSIPSRVGGTHNTADTFRPYDPSRIVGDTAPNLPVPRQRGGCGGLGAILATVLVIAVVVVASIYTAGVASTLLGSTSWSALGSFTATMSAGATAMAGGAGAAGLVGAVVGGAVGSMAGQGVAIATNLQEDWSWSQVGMAAIGAGITAGLGTATSAITSGWDSAAKWGAGVAKAAVGNALSQVTATVITGHDRFSWRAVAASAVGSGVGGMTGATAPGAGFGEKLLQGTVSGIFAGVTSAVVLKSLSKGGQTVLERIATDAFGNALAGGVVDAIQPEPLRYDPEGDWETRGRAERESALRSRAATDLLAAGNRSRLASPGFMQLELPASLRNTENANPNAVDPELGSPATPAAVRAGDYDGSLERVARAQLGSGATQQEINNYVGQLFEINGITNARRIGPEVQIRLPDAATPAATAGLGLYGQDILFGENRNGPRSGVGMGDVQVAGAQLYEAPTTGTNRPTLGDLARLSERQEAAYWDIQADVNRHRGGWVGGAIDGLRDSREGIDAAAQYARDHSPEALAGYVKANEWSPLADKAVASIQAPQGQVGGRSTGWRGSLTYDQMNNGLGAAGAAGFAGEQLLALPYFEGAWGASRSGQVLRGLGTVGALGGALVDLNAVANYNSNGPGPNALSPERAQTNLVFGAIGVVVPEVGVAYTLLDGLYPKGRYESGFEHFTVDWKAAVEQSQQARESALTGLPQEALWLQGRRR